jgi:hypothetical protein
LFFRTLTFLAVYFFGFSLYAQVKISDSGQGQPNPRAVLELESSQKGFLPPRMSESARDSLTSVPQGLLIYNTTSDCINFYSGQAWFELCGQCVPPPPGMSDSILGPALPCPGDTALQFSVTPQPQVSYTWNFPPGWVQTSGGNSATVTVSAGTQPGVISVTPFTGCGNGPARSKMQQLRASPAVPVFAAISNIQPGQITLNWLAAAEAGAYILDVSDVSDFSTFLPGFQSNNLGNVLSAAVGGLQINQTYYARLRSANVCDTSAFSQVFVFQSCLSSQTLDFSPCGAVGKDGPTQLQCNQFYGGAIQVNVNQGIQEWTVPSGLCGSIVIEAWGAQGGGANGGLGAYARGTFNVNPGDILRILPGQRGGTTGNGAGGGGGSFIVRVSGGGSPTLLVAAGGGGGGVSTAYGAAAGSASNSGNASQSGGTGGTAGNGGNADNCCGGSGGGGYTGNGQNYTAGSQSYGGKSFTNGAQGGYIFQGDFPSFSDGGFGGGGTGASSGVSGGGGGGYSGGGGGPNAGGGGGSFSSGSNPILQSGQRAGDGLIRISW